MYMLAQTFPWHHTDATVSRKGFITDKLYSVRRRVASKEHDPESIRWTMCCIA